jgi:hypothetical protein
VITLSAPEGTCGCCLILVDGHPAGIRPLDSIVLSADSVIEVLPPFAGG